MEQVEAIRHSARQLVRELHLLDGRHCIEGFSFSECHLITELQALGHATASELSDALVLEKSTMSRLVNGLLQKGFIRASEDRSDRRRRLLSLTARGRKGAESIHKYARHQVEAALEYVAEADSQTLLEGLSRYAKVLRYARLGQDYRIRGICKSDNPVVARIIRQVMAEFSAVGQGYSIEDPEVDDMYGAYSSSGSAFYGIEKDGQVLGCGGIGPLAQGDGSTCELRKMYFLPAARGTGVGTRLLRLCLDSARDLGYTRCYLETLSSMNRARQLYRKHGFETLDAPLGDTGHTACNQWMVKEL